MALELNFFEDDPQSLVQALTDRLARGAASLHIRPDSVKARHLAGGLAQKVSGITIYLDAEPGAELPPGVRPAAADQLAEVALLLESDPDKLSALLMDYLESESVAILAPKTAHHYRRRPVFLISIPKSGTHLLYGLMGVLGYGAGIDGCNGLRNGTWYCIEYGNSHTSARGFFVDNARRSPFGNRHHPFMTTPAVFIYRNPLDIVVSEANWYQKDGMNPFAGYYRNMSFEQRLLKLIDDPWLLGSIRDRVGEFIPWLYFDNVIPVAFEEIVGAAGGGGRLRQEKLIWSLQLKLHIDGCPKAFAEKVFDPNSPTFHAGQVGGYRTAFTPEAYQRFFALPQDFMDELGYTGSGPDQIIEIPRYTDVFRRRPLRFSRAGMNLVPVAVEFDFRQHNLIWFRGRYYAVPQSAGAIDLAEASPEQRNQLLSAADLFSLKYQVCEASTKAGGLPTT